MVIGAFFWYSFRDHEFTRGGGMKSVMGTKACAVNRGVICLATAGFPAFLCYGGCLSFLADSLSIPPLGLKKGGIGVVIMAPGVASIFAAPRRRQAGR